MKLTLYSFKSDVPREKVCQPGIEYEVFDSKVEPDEALPFFDRLIFPRDSFYLEGTDLSRRFFGSMSNLFGSKLPEQTFGQPLR